MAKPNWITAARAKAQAKSAPDEEDAAEKPEKPAAGKMAALKAKAKKTGNKKLAQKVALAEKS